MSKVSMDQALEDLASAAGRSVETPDITELYRRVARARGMRHGVVAVIAVTVVGAASGLLWGDWQNGAESATTVSESPVAVYGGEYEIALDGLTTGTLALQGGCLVLTDDRYTDPVVPIFLDKDVEWKDGALVYRRVRFDVGSRVSLGGGFVPAELGPSAAIPAGCEGLERFYAGGINSY